MSRTMRWSGGLLTLIVALIIVGFQVERASAAPCTTCTSTSTIAAMEQAYKVQQQRLAAINTALTYEEHARVNSVNELIGKLKASGKSTSGLEQALKTFLGQIATARAEWQLASTALTTHAGFNADGKVTDTGAARTTLYAAGGHLEQAYRITNAARDALYHTVRPYLGGDTSTHPTPTPVPTPKPPTAVMEQAYKVQQQRLADINTALTYEEHARLSSVNELISKLKAKGTNTSGLEQALKTFLGQIATARAEWQLASTALTTHAGFSTDGKVTDPDAARTTLYAAGGHLEQAYRITNAARDALYHAVAPYLKAG